MKKFFAQTFLVLCWIVSILGELWVVLNAIFDTYESYNERCTAGIFGMFFIALFASTCCWHANLKEDGTI